MLRDTGIPAGTRVRLRHVWDFLALTTNEATVLGPGDTPDLVRIQLDRPGLCRFEDDDQYEITEMAEAADNLDVLLG